MSTEMSALVFTMAAQLEMLQQRVHTLEQLLAMQSEISEMPELIVSGLEVEN